MSWVNDRQRVRRLDALLPQRAPRLQQFRELLLKHAGRERGNYLRSMFDDGYFASTPQEFVASIANQYCGSSADTLDYALHKYDRGNVNQINQFLLMASILSDDKEVTFFRIDPAGRVSSSRHPITKNDGLITSLTHGSVRYVFHFAEGVIHQVERIPN